MEELMALTQEGSLNTYSNDFNFLLEKVRALENISEDYATYLFICGLKIKIGGVIMRLHNYGTGIRLEEAFSFARVQEQYFIRQLFDEMPVDEILDNLTNEDQETINDQILEIQTDCEDESGIKKMGEVHEMFSVNGSKGSKEVMETKDDQELIAEKNEKADEPDQILNDGFESLNGGDEKIVDAFNSVKIQELSAESEIEIQKELESEWAESDKGGEFLGTTGVPYDTNMNYEAVVHKND